MLIAVEAEIDTNGVVTSLEPVTVARKTRAIVTLLEEKAEESESSAAEQPDNALIRWLKTKADDPNAKFPAKIIAADLPVATFRLNMNGLRRTATNTTANTSRSTATRSLPSAVIIRKPPSKRVKSVSTTR